MKYPDSPRRTIVLSGATSGLCAGVAERLASTDYRCIVLTRKGGGDPHRVLARMRRFDADADAVEIDLHDLDAARTVLARIEERHGAIYGAIHGRGPMRIARFVDAKLDDATFLLRENLLNGIALAQLVLPSMRERRSGRLIYFGMTGSSVTRPASGLGFYGAAKAGLCAFAKTLALEEARHGITVNVIEPGDIREKERSRAEAWGMPARNPSGHAGSWEDIADVARFMLSSDAGFMNGAVLAVGGGLVNASE